MVNLYCLADILFFHPDLDSNPNAEEIEHAICSGILKRRATENEGGRRVRRLGRSSRQRNLLY